MSRTHGWQDVFIRVAHFSFLPARSWRAGVGPLFRCDRKGSNSGQSLCDPGRYLTAQSYGWLACGKVDPSAPPSKGPCETKRQCISAAFRPAGVRFPPSSCWPPAVNAHEATESVWKTITCPFETHPATTERSKIGSPLFCCSFSCVKLAFAYSQYPSIMSTFSEMGPCLTHHLIQMTEA